MRNFIFTITAGRTGTAFLAALLEHNLKDAQVHHEILGYDTFGVDTPDVSCYTLFNSQGNVDKVQDFWRHKMQKIIETPVQNYVETSHLLLKAGLVENCATLTETGTVHFIILRRDKLETIISYMMRGDFLNKGNMWMWYLDPLYPRNIINSAPFLNLGREGVCLWYLCEMQARAAYYKLKMATKVNIKFHEITLPELNHPESVAKLVTDLGSPIQPEAIRVPEPKNANPKNNKPNEQYVENLRKAIQNMQFDPATLAQNFIDNGGSLG